MSRRIVTFAAMLMLVLCLVTQATLRADDEKEKVKKEGKYNIVERIQIGDAGGGEETKKMIHFRVVSSSLAEDIAEALKEAGLDDEQLKKVQEIVEKALENVSEAKTQIHKLIPEVIVVGPGGEQRKFELKQLQENLIKEHKLLQENLNPWRTTIVQRVEGAVSENLEEALKEAEEQLKKHGVDNEQLERIRSSLEKAVKSIDRVKRLREKPMDHPVDIGQALGYTNRYMIGVECAPVNEPLRSQLGLEEGAGIVVNAVFDDSPAEKAGIQQYDVLVQVNDKALHKAEDLIEAVQHAGKEEEKLSITVVHGGKERSVEVKPTQRKVLGLSITGTTERQGDDVGRLTLQFEDGEPDKVQRRRLMYSIGPGVVTAQTKAQDAEIKALKTQVEALSAQIKQLQEAMKKLHSDD